MINIRKIALLSALLMSASSLIAPAYAMDYDPGNAKGTASRVKHWEIPLELTSDMISEIKKYGSFSTPTKKYVLKNPEALMTFELLLNSSFPEPFFRSQTHYRSYTHVYYCMNEGFLSQIPNLNHDPKRPEETGPKSTREHYFEESSRLIFKEHDLDFIPKKSSATRIKPEEEVPTSSMQVSSSVNPSHEVDTRAMIIKSLTETYKFDPKALGEALAAFLVNLK